MFPLPSHKGAREQCIATVCDKKGFEDLENGYKSENQCAEGAKLVDSSIELLSSRGIGSTPTYIFPDGRFRSGALDAETLRKRLSQPPPAVPAKTPAATPATPAKKTPPAPAAPK